MQSGGDAGADSSEVALRIPILSEQLFPRPLQPRLPKSHPGGPRDIWENIFFMTSILL